MTLQPSNTLLSRGISFKKLALSRERSKEFMFFQHVASPFCLFESYPTKKEKNLDAKDVIFLFLVTKR